MPTKNKIRTDTGWIIRKTIEGLPEAGKKVGGAIGKTVGKAMQVPAKAVSAVGKAFKSANERVKNYPVLTEEEIKNRKNNNELLKKSLMKYKAKNPRIKIPKRFEELLK
jgi:hypothetical protein